ncbi:hypothetical protein CLOP_g13283 [Closterium sp. NIES-67]|nr:hypothetical protein CLOP_g13283 [Closterium sp. NIES-67]
MAVSSPRHWCSHASWCLVLGLLLLSLSATATAQPTKAQYLSELNTLVARLKKQSCNIMAEAVSQFISQVA